MPSWLSTAYMTLHADQLIIHLTEVLANHGFAVHDGTLSQTGSKIKCGFAMIIEKSEIAREEFRLDVTDCGSTDC